MRKHLFGLYVALALPFFLLTGCATVMTGNPSSLTINSMPEGATVIIRGLNNGEKIVKNTPTEIVLNKNSDYDLQFELQGYQSDTVYIRRKIRGEFWLNLFFADVIGLAIDYTSDNMWVHHPKSVELSLTKKE